MQTQDELINIFSQAQLCAIRGDMAGAMIIWQDHYGQCYRCASEAFTHQVAQSVSRALYLSFYTGMAVVADMCANNVLAFSR